MTAPHAPTFTVRGVFTGFFRDIFGKRRMVLRDGGHEAFLKVSKALRRELREVLAAGDEVLVTGYEVADSRRAVTSVRAAGSEVAITSPILVCTKKNCWRNGGQAIWDALEQRVASGGRADLVKLRGADCLGHCKKGPNVETGGRTFHHCTPRDVDRIFPAFAE